jgi:Tol biopolymer transport system component
MVAAKIAAVSLLISFSAAVAQLQVQPFLNLPGETSDPAISPDGTSLAFAWWQPDMDRWGIYIRAMTGSEPRLFAKTEDGIAYSPKWSPDGKWIAYLASGTPRTSELFIKPVAGGPERGIGAVCSDGVAWTADSRSIIAPNDDDSDSLDSCRLAVVPIEPGGPTWQLAKRGNEPATSGDGKTLAFVKDREIHLISLTREGKAAGPERTLVRESLAVSLPAWVPGDHEIVYQFGWDHSVIRRVEVREGAKSHDDGSIDGEFNGLAFSSKGGPVLAEVASHDDSFLRMDLQSAEPHFETLRRLPWNVANLTLSPHGQRLLYTRSTRSRSEFFTSNPDGTAPHLLFSLPYESVTRVVWSPDGQQFSFTAEPVIEQIAPSHSFWLPQPWPMRLAAC